MSRDNNLPFVSFEQSQRGFVAMLHIADMSAVPEGLDSLLPSVASAYEQTLEAIASGLESIAACRRSRRTVPARLVWDIGDIVFVLVARLATLGFQIDDLYGHMEQHAGMKRKWLEKAVILRRHAPEKDGIPADLPWGRIEKGTRRAAEMIARGELHS